MELQVITSLNASVFFIMMLYATRNDNLEDQRIIRLQTGTPYATRCENPKDHRIISVQTDTPYATRNDNPEDHRIIYLQTATLHVMFA